MNIARGAVVVEEDLIKALQDNVIYGAGLDVFENEPNPDQALLRTRQRRAAAALRRGHHRGPSAGMIGRVRGDIHAFLEGRDFTDATKL